MAGSKVNSTWAPETVLEALAAAWIKRGTAAPSLNQAHLLAVLKSLVAMRVPLEATLNILSKEPKLLHHSVSLWENVLPPLVNFGFSPSQALRVLASHSDLWQGNNQHFYDVLSNVRTLGFRDGKLQNFAAKNPLLFQCSPSEIFKVYNALKMFFKKAHCLIVLEKNPRIFNQTEEDIQAKCTYLLEEMNIQDEESIVRSRVLNRSLLLIKTRHAFLVRAGRYEKPDKRGETQILNPELKSIMDGTDRQFANKVAGLSLAGYKVFQNLFAVEMKEGLLDGEIKEHMASSDEADEGFDESDDEPGEDYSSEWDEEDA